MLSGPAGSLSGIHATLLLVPKIHQTEVQSGLVNAPIKLNVIKLGSSATGSTLGFSLFVFLLLFKMPNSLDISNMHVLN